jgi:hypothetical protein
MLIPLNELVVWTSRPEWLLRQDFALTTVLDQAWMIFGARYQMVASATSRASDLRNAAAVVAIIFARHGFAESLINRID